jgi:flagellar biosynthesis/type III secretory pathway chaperone
MSNYEYKEVLIQEDEILSKVIIEQANLKKAVNDKSWPELSKVISNVNLLMDSFNKLDEKRESVASLVKEDNEEIKALLAQVRGKLVRCRTENKALGDYISITRNFVRSVINNSLPQSRSKVYSRTGNIVQKQPKSVVLNTLY